MKTCLWRTALPLITAILLLAGGAAWGEPAAPGDLQKELLQFRQLLDRQKAQLEEQSRALREQEAKFNNYRQALERRLAEQQQRIDELQSRISSPATPQTAETQQAAPAKAAAATPTEPAPPLDQTVRKESAPIPTVGIPPEQPKEQRPPEIATIFDQPGVLTPRNTLTIEPSLQFSHSSTNRVSLVGYTIIPAILIGKIDIRSVSRDTFVAALSARYGITNRLELETKVPYVYQQESAVSREEGIGTTTESTFNTHQYGLGDVEFGLRYQLNQPTVGPFFIAGIRAKSNTGIGPFEIEIDDKNRLVHPPTGSGFWGIQSSLTAIYPSDPAVFFGSINYLWNIERDVTNETWKGTADPGDAYGFNFGMGMALNEKASFSVGYDHSIIGKTKLNGQVLGTANYTHVGSLLFGYSYRLTDTTNISLALGVGVTEAAPEVQLTLRVPTSF